MKIVVFGANGKVGSKIVAKLLDGGHSVNAFVHSDNYSNDHNNIKVIQGDIHDAKSVQAAVAGCDAVVSALGSWNTATKDIQVEGMRNIIPAMQTNKIDRIISLTGSGARDSTDKNNLFATLNRLAILVVANKVFKDGENHIGLLRKSGLAWTVVRSPAMVESAKKPGFKLSAKAPSPWATIVRDDVAQSMSDLVCNREWLQSSPFIRRSK